MIERFRSKLKYSVITNSFLLIYMSISDRTYPELCADTARIDLNRKCYSEFKSSLLQCYSSTSCHTSWRSLESCGGAHVSKYTFVGLHRLISILFYYSFLFESSSHLLFVLLAIAALNRDLNLFSQFLIYFQFFLSSVARSYNQIIIFYTFQAFIIGFSFS